MIMGVTRSPVLEDSVQLSCKILLHSQSGPRSMNQVNLPLVAIQSEQGLIRSKRISFVDVCEWSQPRYKHKVHSMDSMPNLTSAREFSH